MVRMQASNATVILYAQIKIAAISICKCNYSINQFIIMQFFFITFEFYLQSFPFRNNQIHLYHTNYITRV